MVYISMDVEAGGPCPGIYSMVSFGAVVVEPGLSRTWYAELAPITDEYVPEALAVSGFSWEETKKFDNPMFVMHDFADWLNKLKETEKRVTFISDNAGFDWQFINFYLHSFTGDNPFGYSPTSLTSLYKGHEKNMKSSFKHLRTTKHNHNALTDAIGNAEVILHLSKTISGLWEN